MPIPNGSQFADNIFKCIFLNENVWISLEISLKFVPMVPINNMPALVQIMGWRRSADKPLSEPMMVRLLTHICVTPPLLNKEAMWVNDSLGELAWLLHERYTAWTMWNDMQGNEWYQFALSEIAPCAWLFYQTDRHCSAYNYAVCSIEYARGFLVLGFVVVIAKYTELEQCANQVHNS